MPVEISVKFSVRKFKKMSFFSAIHEGHVRDLSAGGMSLIVSPALGRRYITNLLQRKKYLFLKFFLPKTSRFLNLTGVPTRIRNVKINDKISTFLGVRFLRVGERDRHELIEFICQKRASFVKENTSDEVKKNK